MLLRATRFGDLRCSTLSWCRRNKISACNAARDRNSPTTADQINLQRSLIRGRSNLLGGDCQPTGVSGRDSRRNDRLNERDIAYWPLADLEMASWNVCFLR